MRTLSKANQKNFKILSLKEEANLGVSEKQQYYFLLRKFLRKRKPAVTTKGATTIAPHLKGITNKLATCLTKAFTNKNIEWICDGKENIPESTAIFAYTHQGILDNFVWIPCMKRHCVLLHGLEVNKLLLLCQLNTGLILVRKGDRENNNNAKLDMIHLLLNGHSITYYPEGTWNLSPNKLHLPMSYGCFDIAKKAGVPVVPAVIEYTYDSSTEKERVTKIHIKYGSPIHVNMEDDLQEKLQEYSAAISTMRWDLISEKGMFHRTDISLDEYSNFLKGNYRNLHFGKLNIDKERKNIFSANDEFYQYFPINDIPIENLSV